LNFFSRKLSCTLIVLTVAITTAFDVSAVEVVGQRIPDQITLDDTELVLNGAGIRTLVFLKIYVGALYLPTKQTTAANVLASNGAKRLALHLLRDLSAAQISSALDDMSNNLAAAEREAFKDRFLELKATMAAVGAAKKNSILTIDFTPSAGLRIALDGVQKGNTIEGEAFYRALLGIWLGDKPVDSALKRGMLGATPN
jgi:Chalcone isomerase-like